MINISVKPSTKGHKLIIKNHNGEPFNHFYNKPSDAKKAWKAFEKQVKAGRVKFL